MWSQRREEGADEGRRRGRKRRGGEERDERRAARELCAQHSASRWQHCPGHSMRRGCQAPSLHRPGEGTWAPRTQPRTCLGHCPTSQGDPGRVASAPTPGSSTAGPEVALQPLLSGASHSPTFFLGDPSRLSLPLGPLASSPALPPSVGGGWEQDWAKALPRPHSVFGGPGAQICPLPHGQWRWPRPSLLPGQQPLPLHPRGARAPQERGWADRAVAEAGEAHLRAEDQLWG